ncbi:MAG: VCBS domain-containing protein [Methylobacter sp.]|nr:VCBS domain-containing protein [Methylobacter sp.]
MITLSIESSAPHFVTTDRYNRFKKILQQPTSMLNTDSALFKPWLKLIHCQLPTATGSELIIADGLCPQIAELLTDALQPVAALGSIATPLAAITARLAGQKLHTLHLVAHGQAGAFSLGGQHIDAELLRANADLLAQWQVQRIALWSCSVGQDAEFIRLLSELTGAQVFASEQPLGKLGRTNNWQLDTDAINAPFKAEILEQWEYQLAILSFINAYEMVYDLNNDGQINNTERWAEKEQNTHYFNTQSLGKATIDDNTNSQYFSGNDVSAIGINIAGKEYFGWISRPIKANGLVRGFYFWTDDDFVNLATAQNDGNTDGDRNVTDNRGFLLVVDQAWFDLQTTKSTQYTINNTKDGILGAIQVAVVGSSSDRVDSALNALVVPNSAPTPVSDVLTVLEDSANNIGNVLTNDTDPNNDPLTVTGFTINGTAGTLGQAFTITNVGSFTLAANGAFNFTPVANYAGAVPAITYTVSDGNGGTASTTLSISITEVNDAPSGDNATIAVREGTGYTFTAADFGFTDANDSPANRLQSVIITTLPTAGTLTLDGQAVTVSQEITAADLTKLVFTPTGRTEATFTFQVRDDGGTANGGVDLDPTPNTLTLPVTAVNQAPTAVADTAAIAADGTSITSTEPQRLLANDTDPDNDTLSVIGVTGAGATNLDNGTYTVQGLYGILTVNASNGQYTYTLNTDATTLAALRALPAGSTSTTETFQYTAADIGNLTSTSTLTITINGVNDAPTAVDDANVAKETTTGTGAVTGFSATGNVLDNDIDPDVGDTKTVTEIVLTTTATGTSASGATVLSFDSLNSNVNVGYYAFVDTAGSPGTALRDAANNQITILSINTTAKTFTLSGTVANVTLIDNMVLGFANNTAGTGGTYRTSAISSATTSGGTEATLTNVQSAITLGMTVSGTGISEDTTVQNVTTDGNGMVTGVTLSKAASLNGTALTFTAPSVTPGIAIVGAHGTLTLNANGSYTYTPTTDNTALTEGQSAVETFHYTMRDNAELTSSAVLRITVLGSGTNDPTAYPDTNSVTENSGTPATGNMLTDGTADTTPTGTLTVSHAQSLSGAAVAVGTGTEVAGQYGILTISNTGVYSYALNDANAQVNALQAGQTLTETFTYRTTNGTGVAASTLTITINGANDAPTANPDTATAREEGGIANGTTGVNPTGNVLTNDTDPDTGDTLRVASVDTGATITGGAATVTPGNPMTVNGQYGSLLIHSDGSYTYTLNNDNATVQALNVGGTTLTETFAYQAADLAEATADSTLAITIHGANDAPTHVIPTDPATVAEGGTVSLAGITVADVDNDTLTVVLAVGNGILNVPNLNDATVAAGAIGTGALTLTGTKAQLDAALATLTYTGGADFSGTDVLRVTTRDPGGLEATSTRDITVSPDKRALTVTGTTVNEASPYIVFSVAGGEGQKVSLTLQATDTGTGHATLGADLLPNLEVFNGTAWVAYTGTTATVPAGGTLLVRAAVLQDTIYEGEETIKLVASNTANTGFEGIGAIRDDAQGEIFLADNNSIVPTLDTHNDYPAHLDDDRPISVNNIAVNEASPYAVFTVTGAVDQIIQLALHEGSARIVGSTNTEIEEPTEDFGSGLQYYNGSQWVDYTAGSNITLTGSTLLIRTAIINDDVFEGQEGFALGVTKISAGTTVYGTASIYDDGTGDVYLESNTTGTPNATTDEDYPDLDDDRSLEFATDDVDVNENSDLVIFTLTGDSGQTVTLELLNNTGAETGQATIPAILEPNTSNERSAIKIYMGTDALGNPIWESYDPNKALPTFNEQGKIFVAVDIRAEQDDIYEGPETFELKATLARQDFTDTDTPAPFNIPSTNLAHTVTATATIHDDGTSVIFTGVIDNNSPVTTEGNLDNDRPEDLAGLTLSKTTLSTSENGTSDSFTVKLNAQPTTDVTVTLTGLDATEGSLSATTLTFTPENWNTPQTVTVTGVDDDLIDGDITYTLTATTSGDSAYNGGNAKTATVAVTNSDNDSAGLTLSKTTLSTSEEGSSDSFTVKLNAQPTANVTVTLTGLDATEGSLSATTLTFTPANWNTPQTVTVTGVDDDLIDGDITYTLTATTSGDSAYNGGNTKTATVAVTNSDNDRAVTITSPTVNEASPYAVFTVTGAAGQTVGLTLAAGTATGGGIDFGSSTPTTNLEYSLDNGANWLAYSNTPNPTLTGTTLLVRTPVIEDTLADNGETFTLTATPAGGSAVIGTATINDQGGGIIFNADGTENTTAPKSDDRAVTITSPTVNEASPYAVFTVTGAAGQQVKLALGNTSTTTDVDATLGIDTGNAGNGVPLQYFNGTSWVDYAPDSLVAIPTGGNTLLVRTRIINDNLNEGAETFTLTATPNGGSPVVGIATIKDDGTGDIYPDNNTGATDPNAVKDDDRAINVAITAISEDTGIPGDFITDDSSLIFSGTATAGSTVLIKLFDANNTLVFEATQTAVNGAWSVDRSAFNLAGGSYQIIAEASNSSGQKANANRLLTIDSDIKVTNLDITDATDTGANDLMTAHGNPQLILHASSGLTLSLKGPNGGVLQSSQYAVKEVPLLNGQSRYEVTLLDADLSRPGAQAFGDFANGQAAGNPANATDGTYQIIATTNTGKVAVVGEFIIDTTPPLAPTIDLPASSDSGSSDTDNITGNTVVVLTGTAEPNSKVNLYRPDGQLYATVTSNQLGEWQVTGIDLTKIDGDDRNGILNEDGDFTFTAKTVDIAGNEGPAATLTLTLNRGLLSIDLPDQYDSGESNTDNLTNISLIQLQGNAPSGSRVQVKAPDGTVLGTVTADAQGLWTLVNVNLQAIKNDAGILADGNFTFSADIVDANGQPVPDSNSKLTVTLDTKAPDTPLTIVLTTESDLQTDNTVNNITNIQNPKFYVTLPPADDADIQSGYILKLYATSTAGGAAQLVGSYVLSDTDVANRAAFMVTQPMDDGEYLFSVKLFDSAGNAKNDANTRAEVRTDLDGVAPAIEDAAVHPGGNFMPGDFNGDGIPDHLQNAVATFPLLPTAGQSSAEAFQAGVNAPQASFGSLIAGDLRNPTATVDQIPVASNVQLQKVAVLPLTDDKFAGQTPPANVTPVTDPLQFTIVARDGMTLTDLDPTRDGLQTRVTLEIPEGVVADTYIKFGPTKENPIPHFFEFLAPSQDISQYEDGAVLIRNEQGKVVRIVITLTDGANGDFNLTVDGVIEDPGYLAVRSVAPEPAPAPAPAPTPTPAPAPIPPAKECACDCFNVDGMKIGVEHIRQLVIAPVTSSRIDDTLTTSRSLAEIPVAVGALGEVLLQVAVPVNIGFTSQEIAVNKCDTLTLREQLIIASKPFVASAAEFEHILRKGIDAYVPTVLDSTKVTVRTLIFNQDTLLPSDRVIHVTGAETGAGEAVVIDAHRLAAGTVLQLDNIEFAIVLGEVTVIGGNGSNFVIGDASAQIINGGMHNDTLIGGAGDDQLQSGLNYNYLYDNLGHNLLDGNAGVDTWVEPSLLQNLQAVLVRHPADKVNPYDLVAVNAETGVSSVLRNIELAQINNVTYDITFLQQPGAQLETLGVLWQLLLNQAPGADIIIDYGNLAQNPRALIGQALALAEVKSELDGLSDPEFARLMVSNGLGSTNAAMIKVVEDYLQQHSRADLIEAGINYAPVITHAYGDQGLLLVGEANPTVVITPNLPLASLPLPLSPSTVIKTAANGITVIDGVTAEHRALKTLIVPIVTKARIEDITTPFRTLADIPVAENAAGEVLLTVSIPLGVGFTAEQLIADPKHPLTLTQVLNTAIDHRVDTQALASHFQQLINKFISTQVSNASQVSVRNIVFEQDATATGAAIVITGASGAGEGDTQHPLRQEAVIIDARKLAPNTEIQLHNVEFAAIFGEVRVTGGNDKTFVIGDNAAQFVLLGADDDEIHGSGADDILGSTRGNDKIYGDAGNDWLVGGTGDDSLYGGDGDDILQGGASDAGIWTFALNSQRQMQISFTPVDADLADSTGTTFIRSAFTRTWTMPDGTRDIHDNRVALIEQDYGALEDVALLFQAVVKQLPDTQAINYFAGLGLDGQGLAQIAYDYVAGQHPGLLQQPVKAQVRTVITHVWGSASDELAALGTDYINQGGSWAEGLLYLARHANNRNTLLNADGLLQLTTPLVVGETGWSANAGNDHLFGGAGNDLLIGGIGNNLLDGGEGLDMVAFVGVLADYTIGLQQTSADTIDWVLTNVHSNDSNILRNIELGRIGGDIYRAKDELPTLAVGESKPLADFVQLVGMAEIQALEVPLSWLG